MANMCECRLRVGATYKISFMDHKQADHTWFVGQAVFVRKAKDDFGTGEQHYVFIVDAEECCFPESSVDDREIVGGHA